MIIKTIQALALGVKAGTKVTTWLLKEDIAKGKEILSKTPILKNIEIQNPIVMKTKGGK